MRAILEQAADDDLFEQATFDSEDDDQNAIGEHVAATLSDKDMEDLCAYAEDETVDETIRSYAGKTAYQKPIDGTIGSASAQVRIMLSWVGALPLVLRQTQPGHPHCRL
jgi:hypothetical protein